MMRFLLPALAVALMTGCGGRAFGFEVDGYRSGMSLAEVQHRIGKLNRMSGMDGGDNTRPTYMPPSPESLVATPLFTFCDDKLYFYSLGLDGGFSTFNHILERETARLGHGAYTATNIEGRSSLLWITWQDGDTIEILGLMIAGTNPNPSVTQSWKAETICQPPKR